MRRMKAGVLYFVLVFGVGFVRGTIGTLPVRTRDSDTESRTHAVR